MTLFTTKLAAAVFALILLGLPIQGASGDFEAAMTGADVEDQSFVPGGKHYLYDVEEIDLASGPSAEFAAKDDSLDWHRIRFLEENLWDYDVIAQTEGDVDDNRHRSPCDRPGRLLGRDLLAGPRRRRRNLRRCGSREPVPGSRRCSPATRWRADLLRLNE